MIKKENEYASLIIRAIKSLLVDEEGDIPQIKTDELMEGDNLTHFVHAMANVVPTYFYNHVSGDSKSLLDFNHMANQLVFQYSSKTNK